MMPPEFRLELPMYVREHEDNPSQTCSQVTKSDNPLSRLLDCVKLTIKSDQHITYTVLCAS